MNVTPVDIERIVNEVVRRLSAANGTTTSTTHTTAAPPADVVISDRVVSVESLKGKLDGSSSIVVAADAIVTPAAKDEVRQRGITLMRGSSAQAVTSGQDRVLIACCGPCSVASVSQIATDAGFRAKQLAQAPAEVLSSQLGHELQLNDRAIMVCNQPWSALCYANRHWQLRAVWGIDVATVQSARQSLDPNVLVIEPARLGQTPDAIITEFLKRGAA